MIKIKLTIMIYPDKTRRLFPPSSGGRILLSLLRLEIPASSALLLLASIVYFDLLAGHNYLISSFITALKSKLASTSRNDLRLSGHINRRLLRRFVRRGGLPAVYPRRLQL